MNFLLQKEKTEEDIDVRILREQLEKEIFLHSHTFSSLDGIKQIQDGEIERFKGVIPVGTIEFVGTFLNRVHGIGHMNPIEVPEALREPEFLGRDYRILSKEDLPVAGRWFIKEVSRLKGFLDLGYRDISDIRGSLPEGVYQASGSMDIISEYRIFVSHEVIVNIGHYNGDPQVFPDMPRVRAMIGTYIRDDTRPLSYTLDVAVTDKGTFILEVHPWACIGLYGYLWGGGLAYAYADGFNWYLKHNTPVAGT